MEITTNTFTIVTFILSIVSATLAIAAFFFSWASFNKSSELQIKAQDILTKVSEKVDVVVERTSHQIDKAWDYFTSALPLSIEQIPKETEDKKEEIKEKLLKEARREATEVMKKSGVEPDKLKDIRLKLEALLKKTTERTESMVEQNMLITSFSNLKLVAKPLAKLHGMQIDEKTKLPEIAHFLKDIIPSPAYQDLQDLFTFEEKLKAKEISIETIPDSTINRYLDMSKGLTRYLQRKVAQFKPQ